MDQKNNKANYFSHDSNARNSDKLIRLRMRHKAAGYGVYFMILERLREEPDYMSAKDYNMIAFDLREDASLIKSVVEDFGLFAFTEDDKCFYSESFNRRMAVKDEKARRQSEAGRKAMQRRWGNNGGKSTEDSNGGPSGNVTDLGGNGNLLITDLPQNDNKERKEKERKEKETSAAADAKKSPPPAGGGGDGGGKGGEKEEPLPALEAEARSLLADRTWREAICRRWKLPQEALPALLQAFMDECRCNGKNAHDGPADLRSHANLWLRRRGGFPEAAQAEARRQRQAQEARQAQAAFAPPPGYTSLQWYEELKRRAAAGDPQAKALLGKPP